MKSIALLFLIMGGWIADDAPGWPAYEAGDFLRARDAGEASDIADGLALACRSGLVIGGFYETGEAAVATLHRALDDCDKALKIDPNHKIAGVSYAIALGYEAKRLKKADYVKASKKRLEALLERFPDDAVVVAAYGGWHSAVSNAGLLARIALGGSRKEADKRLREAVALDPVSVGIRYEYVRFLAKGGRSDRREALGELKVFFAMTPRDAAEALMQERMQVLTAPLEADDKDALKDALKASAAFAGLSEVEGPEPYPLEEEE
jgi:tetratricopeptide (TPR) repeat protein